MNAQVFLIFGKSGWIGGLLTELLKSEGATYHLASARLEDRASIISEIEKVCAGVLLVASGAPGVGWRRQDEEDHGGVANCLFFLHASPSYLSSTHHSNYAKTCSLNWFPAHQRCSGSQLPPRMSAPPAFPSLCLQYKPTHVLNAAGLTGRPNVDWCETHKVRQSESVGSSSS